MADDTVTREDMNLAADIAEKFVMADFGGNDIAGLRNGIIGDSAIEAFVRDIARIASLSQGRDGLVEALREIRDVSPVGSDARVLAIAALREASQ